MVHGDAHATNVAGRRGRLIDLELAGVGPPGFDAAAARVAERRYGGSRSARWSPSKS